MVEYQKKILREIKVFLFFFMKFKNNGMILLKKYLNDFIIKCLNWLLIFMIIYDKNIFFTNNNF